MMLGERMTTRAEAIAARALAHRVARIAARLRALRGIEVDVDGGELAVRGARLGARLVEEPALRRWEDAQ